MLCSKTKNKILKGNTQTDNCYRQSKKQNFFIKLMLPEFSACLKI